MAEYLIEDSTLEDIADSIRAKDGTSADIQVSDFAQRIEDIPSGSDTLGDRLKGTITQYTIPNGVTELPPYIFYNCPNLEVGGLQNIITINSYCLMNIKNTIINLPNCTTFISQASTLGNLISATKVEKFLAPKLLNCPSINGYTSAPVGTLNEIDLRSATSVGSLWGHQNLKNVYLPNISTTGTSTFRACSGLEKVLYNSNIGAQCFARQYTTSTTVGGNFTMLVIPNSTPVNLLNVNAFAGTQISGGNGYIYVPRATISTYEGMTNWSVVKDYAQDGTFKAIEDNLTIIENAFEYFEEDFPEFYE